MTPTLPHLYWWKQLTPQWKQAFQETFFRQATEPTEEDLNNLYLTPALRFVGPRAPYPNMSFELGDLSGLRSLSNLEILVCTHQQVETIHEIKPLTRLRSVFLFNNQISSISGIEELFELEQLYLQYNKITSLGPIQKLVKLRELYIHHNCISCLDGLTEEHAEKLEMLFCKPNEALKQKEMMRVERELGIRCRSL